jgi:hypothetical protein
VPAAESTADVAEERGTHVSRGESPSDGGVAREREPDS